MKPSEEKSECLLRLSDLKPGDVLLTHGDEVISKIIAIFGGGEYSHAALFVGGDLIYESEGGDTPVGLKLLEPLGWATINGQRVLLGQVPGNAVRCCVLRHPKMEKVTEKQFATAFGELVAENHGLNYARFQDLIPMANRLPSWLRPLITHVVSLQDQHDEQKNGYVHGDFCSQVVAKFFRNLHLQWSAAAKDPGMTAPFDFSAKDSLFVKQPFTTTRSAVNGKIEPEMGFSGASESDPWTEDMEKLVDYSNQQAAESRKAARLVAAFGKALPDMIKQIQAMSPQELNDLQSAFKNSVKDGR